ncbi:MAG: hypothetical protein LC732_06370, partial [Acidobacteria bacterium]|nr:hypothetical protein [Acidobacteriota bacterium]
MRRAIGLFAVLIVAWPAWGGSLYVESFTGSEGSRPNGWSAANLAIRADPVDAENLAFGLAVSTRVRPVEGPAAGNEGELAIYESAAFPGDAPLRLSLRLLAEGRSAVALLLLDALTREPVLVIERTSGLRISGARGELVLDAPRGWSELTVDLEPGTLAIVGPTGQQHLPFELPPSFLVAVRARGSIALIDDIRIETSGDAPLPSDRAPPKISVFADGIPLADGLLAGSPIEIAIEIEDESPATFEATLDGRPFLPGTVDVEGHHDLRVEARDEHGNRAIATFGFTLDLTPPQLRVLEGTPPCTSAAEITIRGTVDDAHLEAMELVEAGVRHPIRPDADGTWELVLRDLVEGTHAMRIEASDRVGRVSSTLLSTRVDRTPPAISILLDGIPAPGALITNRPVPLMVSVDDEDPAVSLTVLLDDSPWTPGGSVDAEGRHQLRAESTDCAGNVSQRTFAFEIDTVAPVFESVEPSHGSETGELPMALQGRVSEDAVLVMLAGSAASTSPSEGKFNLPVSAAEGENRFTLRAVDRAGNEGEIEYRFTVNTRAPSIEILEGGVPLADGALFNREVSIEVRSGDAGATIQASLNGIPFDSVKIASGDGSHTVEVEAVSSLGHRRSAARSFRIDTTPPAVVISSPAPGAVAGDRILVTGTSDDAVSVIAGGISARVSEGQFEATVAIDGDEALIVAVGRDAAGNIGRDQVLVTRDPLVRGIILTHPADGTVTNRAAIRVTGRVLSPSLVQSLTVGATSVPVDPAGSFVLDAFPLAEGSNAITATAVSTTGRSSAVTVNVIADRMPPRLRILERGAPMPDQARFASAAHLSLEAIDENALHSSEARMNGVIVSMPATVTASGGHTVVAVAMDAAGNETRVERTFFIGGASGGGCGLDGFVPASGAI